MSHVLAANNAKRSGLMVRLKVTRQRFEAQTAVPVRSTIGAMSDAKRDARAVSLKTQVVSLLAMSESSTHITNVYAFSSETWKPVGQHEVFILSFCFCFSWECCLGPDRSTLYEICSGLRQVLCHG